MSAGSLASQAWRCPSLPAAAIVRLGWAGVNGGYATEQGHFVDEVRGVIVRVEPRFRKEYDPERLAAVFPRLAGCVKPAVDASQLEACLRAGMVTDTELEREGVLTRTLQARALIVKPLGRRA